MRQKNDEFAYAQDGNKIVCSIHIRDNSVPCEDSPLKFSENYLPRRTSIQCHLKQDCYQLAWEDVMKLKTKNGMHTGETKISRRNPSAHGTRIRRKCVNLALTTRIDGDVAILHCGGDIVLGNEAAALCDTLLNLVREYRYIIVNLSSVRSVDGRGLGTLAECIDISRRKGSQIVFCNVPRRVRQLLDLTRLSSQVEIAATETDALEASRAAA